MPDFSSRLKKLRKDKGLKQIDMISILNCTEQHYQRIEYGKVNIPYQTLILFADYFGVSLDYLVGRCDNPAGNQMKYSNLNSDLASIFETLSPETQKCLIAIAKELLVAQEQLLYNEKKREKFKSKTFAPPSYAAKGGGVQEVDTEAYKDFEKLNKAVKENNDKE